MPKYLLIFALLLSYSAALAQGTFKGRVFEDKTRVGLGNIWIENLNNKQNTLSDKKGNFSIPAKLGDLVLFKSFGYYNDTAVVTSLGNSEIFMLPQNIQLKQVDITTTDLAKKFKDYDKEYHGQTMVYHRDRMGNLDGGAVFRVHYWKKGERDKAKLAKKLHDFDMMDRIHELFVPATVGQYVPLKGEELDNFISLYTPSVKVFDRKDFNMITYMSDSYKQYQALPPDKRKPATLNN